RAERSAELTARRFRVEITLASRDMQSWRDELIALESRVAELRESAPRLEAAVREAEQARDDAHDGRAAAEAHRGELAHLVAALREEVQSLRAEIAVSEERHRDAVARRERAEEERRDGQLVGEKLDVERGRAASERQELQTALDARDEELRRRTADELVARERVSAGRSASEHAEGVARAARDEI